MRQRSTCPSTFLLTNQPFNLPTRGQQDEDLLKAEQARWHIGQHNAPCTPEEALFTHLALLLVGFSSQSLAALLRNFGRNPFHQQAHGQVACGGKHNTYLQALSDLLGDQCTQIKPMLVARLHNQTWRPAREKKAPSAKPRSAIESPPTGISSNARGLRLSL